MPKKTPLQCNEDSRKIGRKFLSVGVACLMVSSLASAQDEMLPVEEMLSLSIEELMNLNIRSVSQKEEALFSAALDSSVLTRKEIVASGATSIPDALRLVPGVIVKEISNGVYDIHIRGLDGGAPDNPLAATLSTETLVTVDGRIVYSYLRGGVFWETFPVTIDQIEKIEVVRGPMASLYGPNAAHGVIAIYSREEEREGVHAAVNAHAGGRAIGAEDRRFNEQISFKNDDIQARLFHSYEKRSRHQDEAFSFQDQDFLNPAEFQRYEIAGGNDVFARFSDPDTSLEVQNVMGSIEAQGRGDNRYNLTVGYQDSSVWTVQLPDDFSHAVRQRSNSYFVSTNLFHDGWQFKLDYTDGNQGRWLFGRATDNNNSWSRFKILDTSLIYRYQFGNFEIRPELNFREAQVSARILGDENYRDLQTISGSLKGEYATEKVKITAAIRGDRYDPNENDHFNYTVSAMYLPVANTSVRVAHGRATRSYFIFDTYANGTLEPNGPLFVGTEDYDPYAIYTTEAGIRHSRGDFLFDVTTFYSQAEDRGDFVFDRVDFLPTGIQPVLEFQNLPLDFIMYGVTSSVSYLPNKTVSMRVFATLQESRWDGSVLVSDPPGSPLQLSDVTGRNEYSPTFYGGFSGTYTGIEKLSLNSTLYFYHYHGGHQFFGLGGPGPGPFIEKGEYLDSNALLTLTARYQIDERVTLQATARNIGLTGAKKQFSLMDDIDATYYLGVNFEL